MTKMTKAKIKALYLMLESLPISEKISGNDMLF